MNTRFHLRWYHSIPFRVCIVSLPISRVCAMTYWIPRGVRPMIPARASASLGRQFLSVISHNSNHDAFNSPPAVCQSIVPVRSSTWWHIRSLVPINMEWCTERLGHRYHTDSTHGVICCTFQSETHTHTHTHTQPVNQSPQLLSSLWQS